MVNPRFNRYVRLYASMLDCCDRGGLRGGFMYTVAMLALGVACALNLLTGVNLLWLLRVLHAPYGRGGGLHPQHYVYALLYGGLIANTILARIAFDAGRSGPEPTRANRSGPVYALGSVLLFAVTLIVGLLAHG